MLTSFNRKQKLRPWTRCLQALLRLRSVILITLHLKYDEAEISLVMGKRLQSLVQPEHVGIVKGHHVSISPQNYHALFMQ